MVNHPANRPKLIKDDALKYLAAFKLDSSVCVLGIRGYYEKTMGKPDQNDRGIYDDALCVISPIFFRTYNANVDPSIDRKGIASLVPGGPYLYKVGIHHPGKPTAYEALRQFGRVKVLRDGSDTPVIDSPANPFYIDIHKGSYNSTSSEGCQTIYPDQWPGFLQDVKSQLKIYNQFIIPYYLVDFV